MPASYSRSTSSRRAQRKVLQQLAEELRAEYMEGKEAAAVGTRWAAAEATLQQQQTRTQRQCRSERAANRTKHRTLEMPQARVTVRGERR